MSSAEEHFRHPAEDRALLRLTTARPAELASAIGPDLRPGYSAGLVAPDGAPDAASADPRSALADSGGASVGSGGASGDLRAAGGASQVASAGRHAAFAGPHASSPVPRATPADPGGASPGGRAKGGGVAGSFDVAGGAALELAAAVAADLRSADRRPSSPVRLAAVPDPGRPATPAVPVDAALWLEVGALIPEVARRRRQPGRRRRDDRAVLEGILHVLATGIGWRELPQDLGCGSGVTCWRRLREWVDGGTWAAVEPRLRAALGPACGVDWDRPWAGTGRSPLTDATARAPATGGPPATAHDPGATPGAVARRLAWTGPSLV